MIARCVLKNLVEARANNLRDFCGFFAYILSERLSERLSGRKSLSCDRTRRSRILNMLSTAERLASISDREPTASSATEFAKYHLASAPFRAVYGER